MIDGEAGMARVRGARFCAAFLAVVALVAGVTAVPAFVPAVPTSAGSAAGAATNVTRDQMRGAYGTSSAIVAVPNSAREVVVAFLSLNDVSAGQTATVAGGGFAWHLARRNNAQRGDAEIWWATTAAKSFAVTATANQRGRRIQLTVMTFAGSAGVGTIATASSVQGAPAVSLTPVASGSWIGAVGMDFDRAVARTVGPGQILDAQNLDAAGDTYWVQHRNAASVAGTKVSITDTAPTADRFELVAIEVTGPRPAGVVALDGSTPPVATVANNSTSVASAAFSPPARTVLYAVFSMDSLPGSGDFVSAVTNSGATLQWRQTNLENHTNNTNVGGYVQVFWAYNVYRQTGVKVTAAFNGPTKNVVAPVGLMQVLVIDNAGANQATAASRAAWNVTGTSAPSATVTTTAAKSLVFSVFDNWDSSVAPAVPAGQTVTSIVQNDADRDAYWLQARTAPTPAPAAVTMNATAPSDIHWHEIAWEILAA
jgi:hypothetical protein